MLRETALRRASVGCAVNTGWNRSACRRWSAVSSPTSVGELHERGGDGVRRALLLGPSIALAEHPHALVLLDEVHQVEVAR